MNTNLVNEITASQLKKDVPHFSTGDTLAVSVRIIENESKSLKAFALLIVAVEFLNPSSSEKLLVVLVLKELSSFTLQQLLKLMSREKVKFVATRFTSYVRDLVKPLDLKKFSNLYNKKIINNFARNVTRLRKQPFFV